MESAVLFWCAIGLFVLVAAMLLAAVLYVGRSKTRTGEYVNDALLGHLDRLENKLMSRNYAEYASGRQIEQQSPPEKPDEPEPEWGEAITIPTPPTAKGRCASQE